MFTREKTIAFINTSKFHLLVISIVISAIIPLLVAKFFIHILTLIVIFTIYASSWNLLASSGQGSLGHAAFLGIGGFTSSLLAVNWDIHPIIGVLIGAILSAGIGFLIGLTCVRLKAWFLAMVTFGFSIIAGTLVRHFDSFTHGTFGFRTELLVPLGLPFYYLALCFAILSISIIYYITKSKMGLAFRAIEENESEAKMIGINTPKYKLLAFVISTFFAGLAGGLYVHFIRYISVSIFSAGNSFKPLMMTVIGGLGAIEGPIIGSIMIVTIEEYLLTLPIIDRGLNALMGSWFPEVSNIAPPLADLFFGLFIVLIVIFAPKGVSSLLRRLYSYLRSEEEVVA